VLASGSQWAEGEAAGDLLLWDMRRREQLMGSLPGHKTEIPSLALDPTGPGFRLAAAHENGVSLWQLDAETWIATACRIAARELTPDEWAEAIGGALAFETACPR